MIIKIISYPIYFEGESDLINDLFALGMDSFHLRKPNSGYAELCTLLNSIKQQYHPRIVIHKQLDLIDKYNLMGIHLSKADFDLFSKYATYNCSKSYSAHSIDEIRQLQQQVDYCFLSPIFDSISKIGYKSQFDLLELSTDIDAVDTELTALGGICPENLSQCRDIGFESAAVLGSIWDQPERISKTQVLINFDRIMKAAAI